MTNATYESELEKRGKIAFTVNGVSMRPLFHAHDDVILVERCDVENLANLDIVLFRRPSPGGVQYVLHRIVARKPNGDYIIAGDNCVSYDVVPPREILGIVTSAQRKQEPIRLSGFRHSLYLKLWCKPYKFRFKVLAVRNKLKAIARKIIRRGR